MSELRLDRLRGVWVLLAPERRGAGADPATRRALSLPAPAGPCPFCPGSEALTQTQRLRWPASGPWQVRVVDNRFPLFTSEPAEPAPSEPSSDALRRPGRGRHEVVIEHPSHDLDLPELPAEQVHAVLLAVRDRFRALAAEPGLRELIFFRNRGARAGSSQPHPHSQIVALAHLSDERRRRQRRADEHARREGRSLLLSVLEEEVFDGERELLRSPRFSAFCPAAPQRPGLVRLAPRSGEGAFADLDPEALGELASLLRALLRAHLERSGAPYNLLLHEPPLGLAPGPSRFWVLEIVPRTSGWAGFELASGTEVVLVSPEESAGALRASPALRGLELQGIPKLPGE